MFEKNVNFHFFVKVHRSKAEFYVDFKSVLILFVAIIVLKTQVFEEDKVHQKYIKNL